MIESVTPVSHLAWMLWDSDKELLTDLELMKEPPLLFQRGHLTERLVYLLTHPIDSVDAAKEILEIFEKLQGIMPEIVKFPKIVTRISEANDIWEKGSLLCISEVRDEQGAYAALWGSHRKTRRSACFVLFEFIDQSLEKLVDLALQSEARSIKRMCGWTRETDPSIETIKERISRLKGRWEHRDAVAVWHQGKGLLLEPLLKIIHGTYANESPSAGNERIFQNFLHLPKESELRIRNLKVLLAHDYGQRVWDSIGMLVFKDGLSTEELKLVDEDQNARALIKKKSEEERLEKEFLAKLLSAQGNLEKLLSLEKEALNGPCVVEWFRAACALAANVIDFNKLYVVALKVPEKDPLFSFYQRLRPGLTEVEKFELGVSLCAWIKDVTAVSKGNLEEVLIADALANPDPINALAKLYSSVSCNVKFIRLYFAKILETNDVARIKTLLRSVSRQKRGCDKNQEEKDGRELKLEILTALYGYAQSLDELASYHKEFNEPLHYFMAMVELLNKRNLKMKEQE